jgi:hypothetical protein
MSKFVALFIISLFSAIVYCSDNDITVLFTAVATGDNEAAEELLNKGVNVNAKDRYGNTALLIAAENGRANIANFLIAKGASLEDANIYGYTPVFAAVVNGNAEMIEFLIGCGSRVDAKNRYASSPLDYIQAKGYRDVADYLAGIREGSVAVRSGPNSYLYISKKLPAKPTDPQSLIQSSELSAAESSDSHALYQLGQHYSDGINPIDSSLGFEYFAKAANIGHTDAKALMARAVLLGLGTVQDYAKAEMLTKEALDKGSAEAVYVMGIKYYYGIGVEKDKGLGIIYFAKAHGNGSIYAAEQLRLFFAEDVLNYIKTADNRVKLKTYLLSTGAVMTESTVECDIYSLKAVIPSEYGLKGVTICYTSEKTKSSTKFDITPDIDPVYKELLLNYLEVR